MNTITDNIKNAVTVIVISEFLKSFFISESYKKYISASINVLILAFLVSQIAKTKIDFDFSSVNVPSVAYENKISEEYEKSIEESLKKEYEKENIVIENIIIETDEQYNVTALKIYIKNSGDAEKVKNITDKTGIENYEIITKH